MAKSVRHIVVVNSGLESVYGDFVDQLASAGLPADGEVIYSGRNVLMRCEVAGQRLIVKKFRKPNAINSVAYTTVRLSKARRSYENALRLCELGFLTPMPVGYVEVRTGGRLAESYYVCLEVEGDEMRWWERRDDCEALLAAFGKDVALLHERGVWHKDFSPGNILVTCNDGEYAFYYIDLNRMKFGVRSRRRLMSMFGTLNEEEEVSRLARHYARARGEDEAAAAKEAARAYRRFMRRVTRRRAFKKVLHRLKGRKE